MLQIRNLKKKYNDFSLDCSFEVKKGQITGLIGQNGAGKSTTFKALLGLVSFDSGSIKVLGKDIQDFTVKDKEALGVVLSDSGFSGYLTIKDINAILKGFYSEFDSNRFISQVKSAGLPLDKKIKDFSTGMKAKLKVLIAISHKASLLVLDEPTAGLDVVARDELLLMLREYMEQSEDRSILISSHISSDLETLCDDIYMIHNGRIILHEDTDVLLSCYGILKVSEEQFGSLDKKYLLYTKKESFGYSALTDQRQFYIENHPDIVAEKGTIDGIMSIMIKGERI